MKVLILGSDAKEHALTWAVSRSHIISGLYAAPGNSGTAQIAENIDSIDISDPKEVVNTCQTLNINHCIVGAIDSLSNGVVDALKEAGISVCGATQAASRLETDRLYARQFMERYSIPTPHTEVFHNYEDFAEYVASTEEHLVLKRNRSGSTQNVFDSKNRQKLLNFGKEILKEDSLLVEKFENGYNLSIFALMDGENHLILPAVSDYSKANDNNQGSITNGMGAICPVPVLKEKTYAHILTDIIEPTFEGMKKEGLFFKGVFFFSLLIQERGAKVTSYHVRFGDPEAQVLLPLIKSDFGNLIRAIDQGNLGKFPMKLSNDSSVGVVIAAEGYPDREPVSQKVTIVDDVSNRSSILFHGSIHKNGDGHLYTNGGRCFTVVGLGDNIVKANTEAYRGIERVNFPGAWSRKDIGNRYFEE